MLLLFWVDVDDFSFSISVCIIVCVAMIDRAISGIVVCELHPFVTVDVAVVVSPKIIFGYFVIFDPVIKSLMSVLCAVGWYCGDDLVFFICLSLVGGRLCHLGSERFSSRSDVFFQSTAPVRPRGFVVFRSLG